MYYAYRRKWLIVLSLAMEDTNGLPLLDHISLILAVFYDLLPRVNHAIRPSRRTFKLSHRCGYAQVFLGAV
jgi:hypothetical protein